MVQKTFIIVICHLDGGDRTGTGTDAADLTLLDVDLDPAIFGNDVDGLERTKGITYLTSAAQVKQYDAKCPLMGKCLSQMS